MGRFLIVVYKPLPGKEAALAHLVREHVPILRGEKLATDSPFLAMKGADGAVVEVFEWESDEAIHQAHTNPAVQELWKRFAEVCTIEKLSSLAEASDMFATFDPL